MDKLCVELGFCIPQKEQERIASVGRWDATDFAKDVVACDGLNPDYELKWVREIRNRFIDQLGSDHYSSIGANT